VVRGPHLELRYPREDDAPALFRLARDPEVTRFFSWGPYRAEQEARAWLATLPARRAAGSALELAIAERDAGVIGVTLLTELSRRDRRCVLGTWLGRDWWGSGANHESKALITHLAFGPLALERVGAYADVRNLRSQRALERIGFTREGVLHGWHRHGGEPRDVVLYALLRGDWERSPLHAAQVEIAGEPPEAFRP
jgi:ribosomal-protein-alanine N-acetyltransferase